MGDEGIEAFAAAAREYCDFIPRASSMRSGRGASRSTRTGAFTPSMRCELYIEHARAMPAGA